MSQKRDAVYGFLSKVEDSSLRDCPSAPVARAVLNRSISRELKKRLRLTTIIINL